MKITSFFIAHFEHNHTGEMLDLYLTFTYPLLSYNINYIKL